MYFLFTVIGLFLIFMFPQIMAVSLYVSDIIRFTFLKTKSFFKNIGVCYSATRDITVVETTNESADYISDAETIETDCVLHDPYDTDLSENDVYEDSVSEQDAESSSSEESDLSETRSCDSRHSTGSYQIKPCYGPASYSPEYSTDGSTTPTNVHVGFMLHHSSTDDDNTEIVAT